MNWYLGVLKKYVVFRGRARRREYWMFTLFSVIITVVLAVLERIAGPFHESRVLATLYSLAVFLPTLAVAVRRLHDTGRSGWWLLIGFVPFIGWIILSVFLVLDSQPGENQYGANPKGTEILI